MCSTPSSQVRGGITETLSLAPTYLPWERGESSRDAGVSGGLVLEVEASSGTARQTQRQTQRRTGKRGEAAAPGAGPGSLGRRL